MKKYIVSVFLVLLFAYTTIAALSETAYDPTAIHDSVTTADIATSAVTTVEILDGTIIAADIATSAVTSAKILDETIVSADIDDGTISLADMNSSSVDSDNIVNETIVSADIYNGTIVAADIATSAVTTIEILDGTILAGDIATSAVTTTEILNGTIIAEDLASNSVTTVKIADSNVTSAKITDGTIVSADIYNGTIVAVDIATGAVTTIEILDGTILAADIATGAITTVKIADINDTNIANWNTSYDHSQTTTGNPHDINYVRIGLSLEQVIDWTAATQDFNTTGTLKAGAITGTGINLSGLTASQAIMTDGSKNLVSVDYLDQAVKTTSSPTFATPIITGNVQFKGGTNVDQEFTFFNGVTEKGKFVYKGSLTPTDDYFGLWNESGAYMSFFNDVGNMNFYERSPLTTRHIKWYTLNAAGSSKERLRLTNKLDTVDFLVGADPLFPCTLSIAGLTIASGGVQTVDVNSTGTVKSTGYKTGEYTGVADSNFLDKNGRNIVIKAGIITSIGG